MELENGELTSLKGFKKLPNNKISTSRYMGVMALFKLLFEFWSRIGNIIFIILFIVSII
jgi:hypothetical protein